MNPTTMTARVSDQHLQLVNVPLIASGGVDVIQIRFEFCGLWEGCGKTAVFYRNPEEVYHVLVVDNLVTVPWEVLVDDGYFYFGVMGVKSNVRPTEVVKVKVTKGAPTVATIEPEEYTPNLYEQLLARFEQAIAMSPTGGGATFNLSEDYFNGTITGSGVGAYIHILIDGYSVNTDAGLATDWYRVPSHLAPLGPVTLSTTNSELEVSLVPGEFREDGAIRLTQVVVRAQSGEFATYYNVDCEAHYPAAAPYIPELTDLRVDYKERVWDSAWGAVQENLREFDERVTSLEENGTGGGGGSIIVDDKLDPNSTNPVQNKVVTAKFNEVGSSAATAAQTASVAHQRISTLEAAVNAVDNRCGNLVTSIGAVTTSVHQNSEAITTLETQVGDIDTAIGEINATIGDIDTALDGVIATQEETYTTTFTLDGETYTTIKNMTWAKWCDSQYNTNNILECNDEMVVGVVNSDKVVINAKGVTQYKSYVIVDGEAYTSVEQGGDGV